MSHLLTETHKIVCGSPIATTNGGITGAYVSLKNVRNVTIIANLLQAAAHATALGINEATSVGGGGAQAVTAHLPVFKNADVSAGDALVRGTDAASIAATTAIANQILVAVFDPSKLSAGFDCIAATLDDSSEATNFASITYILETRYPQATPPSALVD